MEGRGGGEGREELVRPEIGGGGGGEPVEGGRVDGDASEGVGDGVDGGGGESRAFASDSYDAGLRHCSSNSEKSEIFVTSEEKRLLLDLF